MKSLGVLPTLTTLGTWSLLIMTTVTTSQCTPPAAELPSGAEVLDAFAEGSGGRSALDSIRSVTVTGTYDLASLNLRGTISLKYRNPDRVLFDVSLPGFGEIQRGWNGTVGWARDPQRGLVMLEGPELTTLKRQARRAFSLFPRPAVYASTETLEITEFEGQASYRVEMTVLDDPDPYLDYYDVETGLLLGREETIHTVAGPAQLSGKVSRYRSVDGLTMATFWEHAAGGQTWSATYEAFDFSDLPDSVFEPPPEIAAQLPAEGS